MTYGQTINAKLDSGPEKTMVSDNVLASEDNNSYFHTNFTVIFHTNFNDLDLHNHRSSLPMWITIVL